MIFEDLPTTPTAEELVDKAFSRATRAGRAKSGAEAQQSMLRTATNILTDNLANVVSAWPDLDDADPFYRELAGAVVRRELDSEDDGVDALRQHLSAVSWAARQTREIGREYEGKLTGDPETDRKLRKQAFARLADVVEDVEADLDALGTARNALRDLPDIRADEPAVVVAGYPNVGKSTFVNGVTNARNETARYPFTTTAVHVGHVTRDRVRYQLVDTPGLLDRPAEDRNDIEAQAVSAVTHLADAVLVLVDPSGTCGYPVADQLALRDELAARFDVPVLTVATKTDRDDVTVPPGGDDQYDHGMSVEGDAGVERVLSAAVDATGHEPELPFEG